LAVRSGYRCPTAELRPSLWPSSTSVSMIVMPALSQVPHALQEVIRAGTALFRSAIGRGARLCGTVCLWQPPAAGWQGVGHGRFWARHKMRELALPYALDFMLQHEGAQLLQHNTAAGSLTRRTKKELAATQQRLELASALTVRLSVLPLLCPFQLQSVVTGCGPWLIRCVQDWTASLTSIKCAQTKPRARSQQPPPGCESSITTRLSALIAEKAALLGSGGNNPDTPLVDSLDSLATIELHQFLARSCSELGGGLLSPSALAQHPTPRALAAHMEGLLKVDAL